MLSGGSAADVLGLWQTACSCTSASSWWGQKWLLGSNNISQTWKQRKWHEWSDKWMDEWWRCIFHFQPGGVASVTLNLRCTLIVSTGQLVGNDVSQLSAHFPATRYLLLSVQYTMQSGKLPKVCGPREKKRANNNSCKAPDLSLTPVKLDRGRRLEMWGKQIRVWVSLRRKRHYLCKIIQYIKHANQFILSWSWTDFFNLPSLVCQVTTGLQSLHRPMLAQALTLASYLWPGRNSCLSSVILVFVTFTVCKENQVLWGAYGIFIYWHLFKVKEVFGSATEFYVHSYFIFQVFSYLECKCMFTLFV